MCTRIEYNLRVILLVLFTPNNWIISLLITRNPFWEIFLQIYFNLIRLHVSKLFEQINGQNSWKNWNIMKINAKMNTWCACVCAHCARWRTWNMVILKLPRKKRSKNYKWQRSRYEQNQSFIRSDISPFRIKIHFIARQAINTFAREKTLFLQELFTYDSRL